MAYSPARIAASHKTGKSLKSGDTGVSTGADGGAAPRAVVMIVSVVVWTPALGVTVVGLKVAVVWAGKPATVKETGLENPLALGVTVMVIIAGCPALTGVLAGPLTVNPSTVKVLAELVPPPGVGLVTVTFTLPAVATSLAGIAAVIWVALTNVVGSALPLKLTTEVETKFVPAIVIASAAPPEACVFPPTVAFVTVGDGLLTLNVSAAEGPTVGAGFVTITLKAPPVAMSAAVMAAVSCAALPNVVAFALPLKLTTAFFTNFEPFTVSVKAAPPAAALAGESVLRTGWALLMVKVAPAEVPPPGAGFVTVTEGVPAVAMSAAVIAAIPCVALPKVVVLAAPLKFTTEAATKFVPFTVSVNAVPPAIALDGESVVIVGAGLLTVKFVGTDVPPPGAAFVTVTGKVPAVAMSTAVIVAVTCVALTTVVVFALPLNLTRDCPVTKPVPFTVSVNAAPPAVALDGASEVMVGSGLLTVKFVGADVPPPGAAFVTVTGKVPPAAMSAAAIAAVTCVALTNAVVFAAPLKFTTAPLTKPVPLTVSVNGAPPAVALAGDSDVMAGAGFVPVPFSVTACVVGLASSVIVSVAVLAFSAPGVNVRLITQFAPVFTVAPFVQVVPAATAKSLPFAPPRTAAFDAAKCNTSVPPLVSVTAITPL